MVITNSRYLLTQTVHRMCIAVYTLVTKPWPTFYGKIGATSGIKVVHFQLFLGEMDANEKERKRRKKKQTNC